MVQGKASNFLFRENVSRFDPLFVAAVDVTDTVNVAANRSTGPRRWRQRPLADVQLVRARSGAFV
jgi:hypothetical protein